ncbi:MAG: hypothetical protein K8T20_02330 [Planctomycetes bacterium]|nr:hypothetical protein [Planctomycetota bacterium]
MADSDFWLNYIQTREARDPNVWAVALREARRFWALVRDPAVTRDQAVELLNFMEERNRSQVTAYYEMFLAVQRWFNIRFQEG